jgi:hypothetical protein
MARTPHHTQIVIGPASARPSARITPDWLWYYATDEGAFWRASHGEWLPATPPVGTPGWTPLTAGDGWVVSAPLGVRAAVGRIELRGRASGRSDAVLTELPPQHRPAQTLRVPVASDAGLAVLVIDPSGSVRVADADGSAAIHLNSVSFVLDRP